MTKIDQFRTLIPLNLTVGAATMNHMKPYSISWNQKRQVWIAQVRTKENTWKSKYLPKEFSRSEGLDAELWLATRIKHFYETGTWELPKENKGHDEKKTLNFLKDRWLQYREEDPNTSLNTFRGFSVALKNWVLDNPDFKHHSISSLDIETELTVAEISAWINSLQGAPSSKLQYIQTLKAFLNDAAGLEWLHSEYSNPLDKPLLKKAIKSLSSEKETNKIIAYLKQAEVEKLIATPHSKITDCRRIRELLPIACGLRDSEISALQWKDIDFKEKTIDVSKQLAKRGFLPALQYSDIVKLYGKKHKGKIETIGNAIFAPPKKNSYRLLPLHPLMEKTLKYWKDVGWKTYVGRSPNEDDPIFPRENRSLKTNEQAGDFCFSDSAVLLKKDLERLEMSGGKTFHDLRHTFSHLLECIGATDAQIGVLLGHGAKTVARRNYIGKNLEVFRALVERLPLPEFVQLQKTRISVKPLLKLVEAG